MQYVEPRDICISFPNNATTIIANLFKVDVLFISEKI